MFHKSKLNMLIVGVVALLIMSFGAASAQGEPVWTYGQDATVAVDWMTLTYEIIRDENINAPAAARYYGYAGVTLYESVVPGMPENFSIGGQLTSLPMLPFPEDTQAIDWQSSANGAMAALLTGFFGEISDNGPDYIERIEALKAQWETARTEEAGEDIVAASIAFGEEIAASILKWSTTDNSGPISKRTFTPRIGEPGLWVETTAGQAPIEPYWGEVRPFGMGYAEQCAVPIRLNYSDDPESTFYKQAAEVLETSDNLTDEQRTIARFWVDTPGVSGTPAGHWVLIANQLVEQMELDLAKAAEMYVLLNTALADSFISAWSLKYQVNLLRPVTYIQKNLRRNWTPYIESPPFPEYPSGHSVTSGAAAEVLTTMFGQVAFIDRTPILNGHENIQRSFTSFEAAASEAAISRMYGGIHFRAAIENGLRQGRCVGQQVLNNIRLRPIPQGEG